MNTEMNIIYDEPLLHTTPGDKRTFSEANSLSRSDIRRILSRRAHEKHKEKIAQMNYDMKRGKCPAVTSSPDILLHKVTANDVTLAIDSWTYLVKFSRVEGAKLINTFYTNYPQFYSKIRALNAPLSPADRDKQLTNQGARLVDDVMTLLSNLHNPATAIELLLGHLERMLQLGHDTASLGEHKSTFLKHMQTTLGSRWSNKLTLVWSRIIDGIVLFWRELLRDRSQHMREALD